MLWYERGKLSPATDMISGEHLRLHDGSSAMLIKHSMVTCLRVLDSLQLWTLMRPSDPMLANKQIHTVKNHNT